MGLVEGADTLIGGTNPTFMRKGLSGGERKRLVIATELLQCPSILLLDEVSPSRLPCQPLDGLGTDKMTAVPPPFPASSPS